MNARRTDAGNRWGRGRSTNVLLLWAAAAWLPTLAANAEPAAWLIVESGGSPFVTGMGSATSQGVSVLNVDAARTTFGLTGAGIKIGVISDSFNGSGSSPTLDSQIAAGDLPGTGNPAGYTNGVTVLKDDSGTDEGRAMLEIVHDVAPAAQLFFHSAFNNTQTPGWTSHETAAPDQTIADAIDALAGVPGMRLIVDDVGILTAPRFQDGAAARAVDTAFANGIGYFSAAGNSATNATRVTTAVGAGASVNWGSDTLLRMTIGGNTTARVVLQWGEPYPSVSGRTTTSDFAIQAVSTDGATTFFTVDGQWAGEDPYEFVTVTNSGPSGDFAFRVNRLSGTTPVLMQLSTFGGIAITDPDDTNSPTVSGHAAAAGAVAVAASPWFSPTTIESFSSRGPTQILFDQQGNAVDEIRQTPHVTAPDGGTTTTAGFTSFFGTSAAAPHAAAVAALVLERFGQTGITVSTRDLYRVLYDSAIDIGTPGFDTTSGYGRLDALAAVTAGRIWDGNGTTPGVSGTGAWSQARWTLETTGDKPTGVFIRGQQAIFGSGTATPTSYTVTVDGEYDVAGLRFTRDTVTLAAGGGMLRLTAPTVDVDAGLAATVQTAITGTAGLTKTGAGRLVVGGSLAITGGTTIDAGVLSMDGSLVTALTTVADWATLAGSGTLHGAITGGGQVAPGNSPGVLTATSVDPSSGLDFAFEVTGTAPDMAAPFSSVNDILRLTDPSAPFAAPLGSGNVVDVFFASVTSLGQLQSLTGTTFLAGFATTSAFDLLSSVHAASFRYWIYGDGGGLGASHDGLGYYGLRTFDPEWTRSFAVGVASLPDGSAVTSFTVIVPEPNAVALAGLGLVLLAAARHHRASTARPPRSAIGSGTTLSSMSAKCISVALTARALAQARYQPRNTCDGKWALSVMREKPVNVEQT